MNNTVGPDSLFSLVRMLNIHAYKVIYLAFVMRILHLTLVNIFLDILTFLDHILPGNITAYIHLLYRNL